ACSQPPTYYRLPLIRCAFDLASTCSQSYLAYPLRFFLFFLIVGKLLLLYHPVIHACRL
uniref:Uncharacterized protein n=1 Tax=Oryza brachyantha TaxID=4533 RepID=J3LLM9_ORYBR